MRPSLILYAAAVLGSGLLLLIHGWLATDITEPLPAGLLGFWLVLSLASECFWLETPTGKGMVSTGLAINMAMLFVLSRPHVLAVGALSVGLSDLLLHRRGVLKASFNAAQTVIALAASLAVMRLLGYQSPQTGMPFLETPWPTLSAPITFFVVNTVLVSMAISLDTRTSLWETWTLNYGFGYQVLSSGVLFLLGLTLVVTYNYVGYICGLCYLLFFYFVRDAYHRYVRERRTSNAI